MNPSTFLSQLKSEKPYHAQIIHVEQLASRPAQYAKLARPLNRELAKALRANGVERLFTHQAQAIDMAREGGILPNHGLWVNLLSNLRYVVIDEAQIYRDVFGSQVAGVLRRLRQGPCVCWSCACNRAGSRDRLWAAGSGRSVVPSDSVSYLCYNFTYQPTRGLILWQTK
jgi:hypothetical protein